MKRFWLYGFGLVLLIISVVVGRASHGGRRSDRVGGPFGGSNSTARPAPGETNPHGFDPYHVPEQPLPGSSSQGSGIR